MGSGTVLQCRACNHEQTFFFGIGMRHGMMLFGNMDDAKVIADLVKDADVITEAKALIHEKNAKINPSDGAGNSLYMCPSCETVHDRFYFRISHDDGVFEPTYSCPHCQGRLTKLPDYRNIPVEDIRCSSCQEKGTLIESGVINWD